MNRAPLSVVNDRLAYEPASGIFVWKVDAARNVKAGMRAGSLNARGYVEIRLNKVTYLAHRLAWMVVNGSWPEMDIDHLNGVKTDNRIDNLRLADRFINAQNKRVAPKQSTTGLLGVHRKPARKSFTAAITANRGKKLHLGTFDTAEAAHAAYVAAKRDLHQGGTL